MQPNNKRQTRGMPEHVARNIAFRFMSNEPVNIFECGTGKGINKEVSDNSKKRHEIFSDRSKVEFGILDIINDTIPSNLINNIDFMILDIPDVSLCIQNIKDILKPGGLLAIYLVNFNNLHDLRQVLPSNGFEIEDMVSSRKVNIKLKEIREQLIPYQTLPEDNFEALVLYCRKSY